MSNTQQSKALRLAKEGIEIHSPNMPEYTVCAELCRLHALNQDLVEALRKCSAQLTRLGYSANHADAAIAKATGGAV